MVLDLMHYHNFRYDEKTELNECVYNFSVDNNTIDIKDIWDVYKYLMKNSDMI